MPTPMKARLSPFAAAVKATLERRRLAGPADTVLAALSAGPDSTALVAALAELRDAGALGPVLALHVDHGLRPGGEADARSAAAACAALGVPFRSVRVEVGPGNVQAEARRARYAALRRAALDVGATRIATGHTRTDQAETVLMRLLRGAGARGLAGIPPRRGAVIRPLIDRSRAEGLAHLAARGLAWRDDPTNATPRYLRNRLRQALWPAALALAPRAEAALARAADLAREDERALSARARRLVSAGELGVARLSRSPAAVRRRVVRALWRAAGSPAPLGAAHVETVLGILGPGRPRRIRLPAGLEARVRAGRLEVGPPRDPPRPPRPARVEGPGRLRSGGREIEIEARHPAAVPWPLELRGRRPGDRIRPEGGAGTKKLAAWLVDRKVPRDLRDGLFVLAAGQDVVAVPELGVVAEGYGVRGAGLRVRVAGPPGGAPDGLQST
ncbi:MAG: tRNA lysidine(34) synthetase TilS [Anaeromyxobacter sp.]